MGGGTMLSILVILIGKMVTIATRLTILWEKII